MVEEIHLVPYDPSWPDKYAAERDVVVSCLIRPPLLIAHMGSTSIPGIAAKPVIDIIVLVADLAEGHAAVPALEATGYSFWRDNPDKSKLYLVRGLPNRTHNLHIHADAEEVRRHLLFRDHLRADPAARDAYQALKQELAIRYRTDREAYSKAKSAFVDDIVAKAGGPDRLFAW
ncbi:MAG: GrpB family protein [Devosia sp.]